MRPHRVLIVGAGFAGLAAAKAIPDSARFEVTMVDRRNHHLFQALLYQVASAGLNPSEIASPVRAIFRNRKNVRVLMAELTGLDKEKRCAIFDGGETQLSYDTLVMAVGGQTSYFGNDHWRAYSFGLKSIEEALALRERVILAFERAEKTTDVEERQRLMTIAVIGGGPTGVELSGAFAELRSNVLRWDFRSINPRDARVVLIEGGPRILNVFPESLSAAALSDLEKLGVEVLLNEKVTNIGEGSLTTTSHTLQAHTVVWAGGISGHPLAKRLGFRTNTKEQIVIDSYLQIPDTGIFCLGDMAEFKETPDDRALPAMAPVAMQQGAHCGLNIVRTEEGLEPLPFHYQDSGIMATVGRTRGVAVIGDRQYSGTRGWLTWLWHHLLRIVDYQNRVIVAARWAWAYVAWKWGVRLVYDRLPQAQVAPCSESEVDSD